MKRVSVFAPMGAVDHQTGILSATLAFAQAGYRVDFYTVRNRRYPLPTFEHPNVQMHVMPVAFDSEREPRWVVTLLFATWMLVMFWRPQRLVFAGGIRGLVAAWLYTRIRRADVINYQTELYIGERLDTRAKRLFKAVERRAAQSCLLTIEHDEHRRMLLSRDLGVPLERILVVPNSPRGPARPASSTLLHRRLNVDPSTRLLLSPGTLNEHFASSLVVSAAQTLPENWRCVLHSAQPRSRDDPYIRHLMSLNPSGRVLFSLDPLPYAQLDDLLASASAGIALYASELGENIAAVGLASGKLSHFLKLGVPVIVSPLPGLADFVRQHRVGEVLEQPQQLPELLARIDADREGYRARALHCFDTQLSYDRCFAPVLAMADRLDQGA